LPHWSGSISTLAGFVQDGADAVPGDPDRQIESIEPNTFFFGVANAMESSNEKLPPATSERYQARARLARQIGRLLACEWLRNRGAIAIESATESSAVDIPPDKDLPARPSR
jgi:hypothetical protein